jgi:hypothetical protein
VTLLARQIQQGKSQVSQVVARLSVTEFAVAKVPGPLQAHTGTILNRT